MASAALTLHHLAELDILKKLFLVFDKNLTILTMVWGKSFCEELALNVDGVLDNLVVSVLAGLVDQMMVDKKIP